MTKPSAAPSMMTPSRSTRVVAVAGSGGIGTRGLGGGFLRGLEGKQDGGVPGGEAPRLGEDGEPRPPPWIVAPAGEIIGERVARLGKLGGAAPDRVRAHQSGRCLAERAGAHLLTELGHAPA